jgi:hypothetical protein
MRKAFVDTTILADATLKCGPQREVAAKALARYEETELPVYALKEFKQGVLKYYAWLHNQLADSGSFAKAVVALHRVGFTPRRQMAQSALEALAIAAKDYARRTIGEIAEKNAPTESADKCLADEYRDFLRYLIFDAWDQRRALTTRVVNDLVCYKEVPPELKDGQIDLEPTRCDPKPECSLAEGFRKQRREIESLIRILDGKSGQHRSQRNALLRLLLSPPGRVRHSDCRALGDSVFALLCPPDSVILTTNLKDHIPLAAAVGKKVEGP